MWGKELLWRTMMSSRHNSNDNWSNNNAGVGREGRRISLSEASNKFWTLFVTWAFVFKQSEDVGTSRVGNSAYKMSRLASNKQTVPCTVSRTADLPEHWVSVSFVYSKQIMFLQFRDCRTKRREHAGPQKVHAAYYTHKRFLLAYQSQNNSVTLFNSSCCFSSC